MKEEMLNRLNNYEADIKDFRRQIRGLDKPLVSRMGLRQEAERLSKLWFEQFENQLKSIFNISKDIIAKYKYLFDHLMRLSRPNNLRSSYINVLDKICKKFKDDLTIQVQQFSYSIESELDLINIIQGLPNIEEQEYLKESVDCANHGFIRASIVLGWCAVMDHIHRKIEKIGFTYFNEASIKMKNKTSGRFKKFNKVYNINSISELREIFDSDVLFILEGMELIEFNENKRLLNCFDLRNNCAHPGEAPITKPNLISFFSDITEIVLRNPKFSI